MKACWLIFAVLRRFSRCALKILFFLNKAKGEVCYCVSRDITDSLMIFFKFRFRDVLIRILQFFFYTKMCDKWILMGVEIVRFCGEFTMY
jgi:hypothetical protein